jgi:hypothetical protein
MVLQNFLLQVPILVLVSTHLAALFVSPFITTGPDMTYWTFLTINIAVAVTHLTIHQPPTLILFHLTGMIVTGVTVVLGHIELLSAILAFGITRPKLPRSETGRTSLFERRSS